MPPANVDVAVPEFLIMVETSNVGVVRIVEAFNHGIVDVDAPVKVNFPDERISPPVIVKPVADERPPVVKTFTPPVKVDVADSVTSNAPAKALLVVDVAVM